MKAKLISYTGASLVLFVSLLFTSASWAQIRELPVRGLPDIAIASYDQFGPVIYYNPDVTQQAGPLLTEFFRAHEYGHHALGHIQREFVEANPYNRAWVRQNFEKEADCFAAKNISTDALRTAMLFFKMKFGHNRADWYHPTGYERASVIQHCSPPQ